jgi:hypothetical protein
MQWRTRSSTKSYGCLMAESNEHTDIWTCRRASKQSKCIGLLLLCHDEFSQSGELHSIDGILVLNPNLTTPL